jgi:hypothetical protein
VFIAGAGGRGTTYASFALQHPERMKVVGVAEPRDFYRERMAETYDLILKVYEPVKGGHA